jgi:hypothetical protein
MELIQQHRAHTLQGHGGRWDGARWGRRGAGRIAGEPGEVCHGEVQEDNKGEGVARRKWRGASAC